MDRSVEKFLGAVNQDECTGILARLVRFRSTSGAPGEADLARFLVDAMEALGLEAFLQEVSPGRWNAIGIWRGTGGGRSVMLSGHIDTNPAGVGWTVDPWGGVVRDGFVYGLGVSNMKAGNAASLCAVKTLMEHGVALPGDVMLTYVVGELQGGIGTLKMLDDGLRADAFVTCEPTDLQALTLHAGSVDFIIELTGRTRHLSKRDEAVDALAAASALVPRINGATFSGAADEIHRSLNRAHVGLLRAALTREFNEDRPPQVADFARLVGAARYAPGQSEASVLADLRRVLDELEEEYPGLDARVSARKAGAGLPPMLPFEVARDAAIVRSLNRAYEVVRHQAQPTGAVAPPCFYWTDAAHLQHRGGMEGVVCGPGGKYNTMPDERVEVADYLDAIRLYMLVILDVCGWDGSGADSRDSP